MQQGKPRLTKRERIILSTFLILSLAFTVWGVLYKFHLMATNTKTQATVTGVERIFHPKGSSYRVNFEYEKPINGQYGTQHETPVEEYKQGDKVTLYVSADGTKAVVGGFRPSALLLYGFFGVIPAIGLFALWRR